MEVRVVDKLWSKVDRKGPDECWPWMGARYRNNYGVIYWEHRMDYAHRVAYLVATGEDPSGKVVRHTCDNPPCCNPDHLLIGTHADNAQDRVDRGRHSHGTHRPDAKLDDDKVREIRRMRRAGVSQRELAQEFGVAQTTISKIVRGVRWTHVIDTEEGE